jgi:hypothetical protein
MAEIYELLPDPERPFAIARRIADENIRHARRSPAGHDAGNASCFEATRRASRAAAMLYKTSDFFDLTDVTEMPLSSTL